MKRRISQGHAMRSTAAFLRVTNLISSLLAFARQANGALCRRPARRLEMVTLDRARKPALEHGQPALVVGANTRAPRQVFRRLAQLLVFLASLGAHAPLDLLLVRLRQLGHRQHVCVTS